MQHRRNSDVIVETLDLKGKVVVDVGCGDGNLVRRLASCGAHVFGVECSARQLAKAAAAEKVGDERIIEGVGQNLPFADESVDAAVFFNSLHHIPVEYMGAALREAHRVLKVGGAVYVSEPVAQGLFFETCKPVDDETQVRAAAQAAIAAADGFEPVQRIDYIHTMSMQSYEAFRDRIISANDEREAVFAALDEQMRALFNANGRSDGKGGMEFDQPMVVCVMRKSA